MCVCVYERDLKKCVVMTTVILQTWGISWIVKIVCVCVFFEGASAKSGKASC